MLSFICRVLSNPSNSIKDYFLEDYNHPTYAEVMLAATGRWGWMDQSAVWIPLKMGRIVFITFLFALQWYMMQSYINALSPESPETVTEFSKANGLKNTNEPLPHSGKGEKKWMCQALTLALPNWRRSNKMLSSSATLGEELSGLLVMSIPGFIWSILHFEEIISDFKKKNHQSGQFLSPGGCISQTLSCWPHHP